MEAAAVVQQNNPRIFGDVFVCVFYLYFHSGYSCFGNFYVIYVFYDATFSSLSDFRVHLVIALEFSFEDYNFRA